MRLPEPGDLVRSDNNSGVFTLNMGERFRDVWFGEQVGSLRFFDWGIVAATVEQAVDAHATYVIFPNAIGWAWCDTREFFTITRLGENDDTVE